MFNEIIMFLISSVFIGVIGYLAWDSYKEFKENDQKLLGKRRWGSKSYTLFFCILTPGLVG